MALNRYGVTFRDWKLAAWVLFGTDNALAEEPGFLDKLFNQYRTHRKRTAYQGLILAYLRDFDPKSKAIRRVGKELASAVAQFNWGWTRRHQQFKIFDPDKAPQEIAGACLRAGPRWDEVLESIGTGRSLTTGGLAAHAWLSAVAQVGRSLQTDNPDLSAFHTMLDWAVVDGEQLRYPNHRAALASALLLPWHDRPAPDDLKTLIVNFLLQYFKDPRLPSNAKHWIGMQEDAIQILRKWLTRVALENFFEVVDQVAQEQMWKYRRAFWLAYYNANLIDDAWVLFGPDAQRYAKRVFEKSQSYGILEKGYQVQPNHSVLLMRIGKLTIADWSHNGKCHIWRDGNRAAPRLYLPRYDRNAVVMHSDNRGQIHYGSANGTWQSQIASYIRDNTGISVSAKAYMPRH